MSDVAKERLSNMAAKLDSSMVFLTLTCDENTDIMGKKEYWRHLKNITQTIIKEYGGFGVWRFDLPKDNTALMHLGIPSKGMDLDVVDEKKKEVKI